MLALNTPSTSEYVLDKNWLTSSSSTRAATHASCSSACFKRLSILFMRGVPEAEEVSAMAAALVCMVLARLVAFGAAASTVAAAASSSAAALRFLSMFSLATSIGFLAAGPLARLLRSFFSFFSFFSFGAALDLDLDLSLAV